LHIVESLESVAVTGRAQSPDRTAGTLIDIVVELTRRNLALRYRGSALGVLWSLLNPAAMSTAYTLIFGATFSSYYGHSLKAYVAALFTGLVVVNFFTSSTQTALTSIVAHGMLATKVKIPLEAFPISDVAAAAFQLFVGSGIALAVAAVFFSRNWVHALLVPIPLFALVLTSLGIALIVSALYVHFRDIPHLYDLVAFAVWLSCPVFYPVQILSARMQEAVQWNPLFATLQSLRDIILNHTLVQPILLGESLGIGIISLLVGWGCFALMRPGLMEPL
jgi:lipopolysaccharide transport system permease protein